VQREIFTQTHWLNSADNEYSRLLTFQVRGDERFLVHENIFAPIFMGAGFYTDARFD